MSPEGCSDEGSFIKTCSPLLTRRTKFKPQAECTKYFSTSGRESAEAEQQKAEAERQRADAERQKADAERQRANQAEAELQALREQLNRLKG